VRISDEAFETYEMDPPSYTLETTKKELKQMYYDMVAVRYVPRSTMRPPARDRIRCIGD
jgi:pyruvate dehydrogenase E1 component alpha subunit